MAADSADGEVMNMRAILIDPTQDGPRFVSDRSEPTRSPGEALCMANYNSPYTRENMLFNQAMSLGLSILACSVSH